MHRFSRLVLVLSLVGMSLLAACVVNVSFDVPQDLVLDANATTLNGVFPADLGSVAVVQQHKSEVQSLSLSSLDAAIGDIDSHNQATSITGTLALRPENGPVDGSQDVQVGTLNNVQITKGTTVRLPGNPQIDAFMLATIKGSGRFSVVVSGTTTGGELHATLHVVLHLDLGYGSFL